MHLMHDSSENGLRERKKAATRLSIETAAVDIVREQGYEAATTEAIAAKAGVSLRTFFNYFPSKDTAIVGESLSPIETGRAHLILEESGADLLKGIARLVEACVTAGDPRSELTRRRRRLIHEHPPLFHRHVIAEAEFDRWLVEVVAGYLKTHPSLRRLSGQTTVHEEARLSVVMVSSAVHYRVRLAIENDVDAALSHNDIEQTIDMMAEIHRKQP